jgi:hypothetical protein
MVTPTHPTTTNAPEGNPTMTTTVTDTAAVRAALVELLTIGQHHHAATRTALATKHPHADYDPTAVFAAPERRLVTLAAALGTVGAALADTDPYNQLNITILRAGLCDLAAVTLSWLDTLPTPGDNAANDNAADVQPF